MPLYARIDVQMPRDKRISSAGYVAELLYVRFILLCKELLTDGELTDQQLQFASVGIPGNPQRTADKLAAQGLIERTETGWRIDPAKWAKWQTTAAEVEAMRDSRSKAGKKGAASRWQTNGKPDGTLPLPLPKAEKGFAISAQMARDRVQSTEKKEESCGEPSEASDSPPPIPAIPKAQKSKAPRPPDGAIEFPVVGNGAFRSWWITSEKADEYRESFPGVDIDQQLRLARQWCIDNATKRKTASGMPAFLNRWISKSQNGQRESGPRDRPPVPNNEDYLAKVRAGK